MSTLQTQVCPNCGAPVERSGNETKVICRFCGTHIAFPSETPSLVIENGLPVTALGNDMTKWIRYFVIFMIVITVCPVIVGVCATVIPLVIGILAAFTPAFFH